MKKRTIVIVLIMFTSVLNLGIMTSNASNIEAIDINPSKEIDGKTITSGLTNISVIDQGDSNRSELWIDGELYAYMDEADDPYHWTYQIDTRGFNDGSHKIQVRSIGGTGGNDIKSKQVWFDNSEPKLKNKSISYPANYNAAKDNSTIYVKAEFEDSISGLDSVSLNPEPLNGTNKEMFDDGKHDDGAVNDGLYSSEKFKVFGETSYSYFNISVKDRIGNNHTYNIEVKMDNIKPTIRNMQVDQPIGQESVKEGDKIRVTGDARDLGLKYSEVSAPSNVDSVLIVDNSASMTEGDMNDAKEAAKTFVETLSPEDRCALYTFEEDGSNPVRKVDYLNMTEENKKIINSTIEELNATASATPIWDSIGEATSYAWNNQKSNHVPSVVSMTDGEDTSSDSYVPGSRWSNFDGLANRTWNMTENHYWGEEKEYDWEVVRYRHPRDSFIWRANTIDSPNRWGLNKAPLPIYNIGLGVSPQASNSSAEGYLDPESTTSDEDCEYIGSHVQSSAYAYNFTQEYDLSTISDSSDGNYHYAPESSELSNIYENISKSIEKKGRKWIGQEAPHGFKNVYLDAHELGQKSMITMYDDGEHGDGKPNDGIYGTEMFDVKTQDTKNATVWMFGEDKAGNINGSYKFLDVDNSPPSIQEKNVNYPNDQNFVSDSQKLSFEVELNDIGSGIERAAINTKPIGGPENLELTENNDDNIYISDTFTVMTGDITDKFNLDLEVSDKSGNIVNDNIYVRTKNTEPNPGSPNIEIINLSPAQVINGNKLIKVNASDEDGITDTQGNPILYLGDLKSKSMDRVSGNKFSGIYEGGLNTSHYPDGNHELKFEVKDSIGALAEKKINVTIDNTPPSGYIYSPDKNEFIEGKYPVKIQASDNIKVNNVTLVINDKEIETSYNRDSGFWTSNLDTTTLNDGEYNASVIIKDLAENKYKSDNTTFIIDNNEPNLHINRPKKDQILFDNTQLSVNVQDEVGIKDVKYWVDNSEKAEMSKSSNNWTADLDTSKFKDGNHVIYFKAEDEAGHETEKEMEVIFDNTGPTSSLISPEEGEYIEDTYDFIAKASDKVGIDEVSLNLKTKTDNCTYKMSYNSNKGNWENDIDTSLLPEGNVEGNVTAIDEAGHSYTSDDITFYIDRNAPTLSVNHPEKEDILTEEVNLSVSSEDEVGLKRVTYRVDNSKTIDMNKSSNKWTANLNTSNFKDGNHVIYFKSEDNAGHETEREVQVVFDNTGPLSYLVKPNINEYIDGSYNFIAEASDEVGIDNVTLKISGNNISRSYNMTYNTESEKWVNEVETSQLPEGEFVSNVTVTDKVGHNHTCNDVEFYIDRNAPTLSVNHPEKEDILTEEVNLSVSSEDEVGLKRVTYRVDNSKTIDMNKSSNKWTANLNTSNFKDGNHVIYFKSEDNAGHETEREVQVVFDNTKPTASLISPDEGEYIESNYEFKAKASDKIGVKEVSLSFRTETGNWTHELNYNSNNGNWENDIDTSQLPESEFKANVTAIDEAGHRYTSDDFIFYIDRNAPAMEIISPSKNEIIKGNYTMKLNSTDELGISSVEYKVDNSPWSSLRQVGENNSIKNYNWIYNLNTSKYNDGSHELILRTIDNAGHETKKKNEITIDNSDPVGNLTNPAHNEFIDGEFTFKAIAMDEVGVQSVIMDIEGDGYDQVHTLNYNENNGYWESLINTNNLPDGDKDLRLEIVDVAGHRTTYEKKFYVDNNAPDLGIKGPKMDEIISDEYDLEVNSSDLVGIKSVKYQIDGSSWVGLEENSELWTRTLDTKQLSDGQHTLKVKSTDMAGHTTEEKIKFIVDNDKPSISIVNPQDDQFIEDELKVQLKVDDNIGIKNVNVNIYSLVSDGNYSNNWTENATYNPSSGYYEISLDTKIESEEGVWRVNASTTDQAGHVSESNDVEFKVDNHKPSLTIHNPRDEDYIQGVVDLNYTAQDAFPTYTEYKVDDSGWVPAVVELDTTKLADGKHSIDVRTTDTAGKSVTQSMDVYVDNTEPTIEIASPIDDQFIDEWFKFKISANDDVGIEDVKLDVFNQSRELSYDSSSGYYIYEVDTRSVSDGTYNLTAIATDPIGNKNISKQIRFRVDNNKPDLTIHSPENEEYINGTIELNVTADDKFLKDVEYTVDNTGYVPIDQELETTKLSEGKHIISVRATDMNGQEKISEISVIVDNEVPKLRVVEPTPYEIVSGEQNINVFAGQEIQNMTISMPKLDEGAAKVMDPLQESESFQYLLNTSRLSDKKGSGRYNGTITAIDRAGHRRTTEFSIKVDNEGPHINKTDPGNKEKNSVKFSAIVDDWSEIDEVKINIDGKGWNEMIYSGNDTYIYNWDTSIEDNGNHTYTIKATDENGNVQTYSESVKVNNSREHWTILQNNVPGFSFIFLLIITLFLIYLTREEIADRLRREEEEDDKGKNGGSSSDEVDTDLMSRLKFSNLYSEKEKKESKKSGKMFGFLPGIGKKKKDKKQKKQLKTLKKVEKDKEDSEEDESSIEEEEPEKFDGLELNKTIINKLIKEDIRDIEDLSEYSVNNLKKYTDLENEEIEKIKTELEKKGYDIKEDKELMSSVIDAEL